MIFESGRVGWLFGLRLFRAFWIVPYKLKRRPTKVSGSDAQKLTIIDEEDEEEQENMVYRDYLEGLILTDAKRFPLTTQEGLSEENQALIDSINLDQLREMIELEEPMTDRQKGRLAELEEKHALRIEAAKKAGIRFTGEPVPDQNNEPEEKPAEKQQPAQAQEDVYRGDPLFRLTDEEAARVAKGHREMIAMPNKPPIDLTKDD